MIRQSLRRLRPHGGNIASAVLGQGLGMVGIAVGTRILTEHASRATFGEAKLLIGLVTFLIGVVVRPFAHFTMRQYHDAAEQGLGHRFHRFARRSQLVLALATGGLLAAGLLLFRPPATQAAWLIPLAVAGMLVMQAMVGIERSILITRNRQAATSFLMVCQYWGLPLLTALALYMTSDTPTVFVAAQAAIWAMLAGIAYWIAGSVTREAKEEVRSPEWREGRIREWIIEARRFVVPMLGIGFFHWIVSIGDRYILVGFVEMSEIGKYAAVYGLISAPFLALGTLMARLVLPFFYKAAATRNDHRRRLMKLGMIGFATSIAVAAAVLVGLLGDVAARLLLAEEYREGVRPLMVWLAVGFGFLTISGSFETEAFASKKTVVMTAGYGLAAAVNIAANLVLIPRNGILGAAQATCLTFAVYLLILAWFDFRNKRPKP